MSETIETAPIASKHVLFTAERDEARYAQSVWYHIGCLRAELQLGQRISRRAELVALVDTIERLLTEKKFDDGFYRGACPDAGPPPPR